MRRPRVFYCTCSHELGGTRKNNRPARCASVVGVGCVPLELEGDVWWTGTNVPRQRRVVAGSVAGRCSFWCRRPCFRPAASRHRRSGAFSKTLHCRGPWGSWQRSTTSIRCCSPECARRRRGGRLSAAGSLLIQRTSFRALGGSGDLCEALLGIVRERQPVPLSQAALVYLLLFLNGGDG